MKSIQIPLTVYVPDNGKKHVIQVAIIEDNNPNGLPDQHTNIYRFNLEVPANEKKIVTLPLQ